MTHHWTTGLKSLGAVTAAALALDGAAALPASAAKAPATLQNGVPAADVCYRNPGNGDYACYAKTERAPASMQCYPSGDHYACYPASARAAATSMPLSYWCDKGAKPADFICHQPVPSPPPPPPNSNNVPPPSH